MLVCIAFQIADVFSLIVLGVNATEYDSKIDYSSPEQHVSKYKQYVPKYKTCLIFLEPIRFPTVLIKIDLISDFFSYK